MDRLHAWDQQAFDSAFLTGNYYYNNQAYKKLNNPGDGVLKTFNNNFCRLR